MIIQLNNKIDLVNTVEISDKDYVVKIKQPVVIRINDFNQNTSRMFSILSSRAVEQNQKILPIIIDSDGGDVYSLNAILDMIEEVKREGIDVLTSVVGRAMSAAAILAVFGTRGMRYISPSSRLMMHETSCEVKGGLSAMRTNVKEVEDLEKELNKKVEEYCCIKLDEKKLSSDWFLSADEAVELNLVDNIGIPKLYFTIESNLEIGDANCN